MTAPARMGPLPSGGGPAPYPHLSSRQLQVVRLAANGHTDQQIANKLGVTLNAVRWVWRYAIKPSLGAVDRTHAVALAITTGLIRADEVHATAEEHACPGT